MKSITPFLWFDNQAEEAVNFYTSVFTRSKIGNIIRYDDAAAKVSRMPEGTVMTVSFELEGQEFAALNGGPIFKFTRAVSFFVSCKTENEIDRIWTKLSEDSTLIFWQLQKYPWSEKYGWLTDKYGVSWQLNLTHASQKITPFLMFDGVQLGKAQNAIDFYVSIFEGSHIDNLQHYGPENKDSEGLIVHSVFTISGQKFMAMDSGKPSDINFNEALTFVVNCESQDEVDYYWDKLSAVPESEQCGWLKDKYGVSWQIVPTVLYELLGGPDPVKSQRATQALMQMKKIDIALLKHSREQ